MPVSLRERKRANRGKARRLGTGLGQAGPGKAQEDEVPRASADQVVEDLRELHERGASRPGAQGSVKVTWSYEIIAPAVVGALILIVLLATG